ncbi:MAG: hypothetical protein KDE05_00615 [Parvularculaceae bacterium]|nr:hypothetical protein [Parvularculaceae bacterium]
MTGDEHCELITDFGVIGTKIRNIRLTLDGTELVAEIVPGEILERQFRNDLKGWPKEMRDALKDTKPIVEAGRALRLQFDNVAAAVAQEEFVSIVAELSTKVSAEQEIGERDPPFGIYRVKNSIWRKKLPEFEGGDNPYLEHFKLLSMECYVDILGVLVGGEWIANN